MKKVKIKIDLDKITKKVIKEHQMLKGELKRIEKLNEGIEYDANHPERMNPSLEDKLRSGEHTFGRNKGLPITGTDQNYSEKLASARFKDIINKVKRYHGIERINPQMMMEMMRIMQEVSQIETQHKEALEQLAVDIVSEEFDIPEDMLDAELLPPGSPLSMENEDEEEEEEEEFQSKSAERMEELEIEVVDDTPAEDRGRPAIIQIAVSLNAGNGLQVSFSFERAFLAIEEFPPDPCKLSCGLIWPSAAYPFPG